MAHQIVVCTPFRNVGEELRAVYKAVHTDTILFNFPKFAMLFGRLNKLGPPKYSIFKLLRQNSDPNLSARV